MASRGLDSQQLLDREKESEWMDSFYAKSYPEQAEDHEGNTGRLVSHTAPLWRHMAPSLSNWNQRFENTACSSPFGVKWKSRGSDSVFKVHILWGHTSVHSTAWKKSSQTEPASTSALSRALLVNYRQEEVEESKILQVPYLNLTDASPTEHPVSWQPEAWYFGSLMLLSTVFPLSQCQQLLVSLLEFHLALSHNLLISTHSWCGRFLERAPSASSSASMPCLASFSWVINCNLQSFLWSEVEGKEGYLQLAHSPVVTQGWGWDFSTWVAGCSFLTWWMVILSFFLSFSVSLYLSPSPACTPTSASAPAPTLLLNVNKLLSRSFSSVLEASHHTTLPHHLKMCWPGEQWLVRADCWAVLWSSQWSQIGW